MLVEFLNLDGKHSYKDVEDQKVDEVIARGDQGFFLKDQKYYKFDHIIENKIAVFKEVDLFTIKVARAKFKIITAKQSIAKAILAQSIDPNEVKKNSLNTFKANLATLKENLEQISESYDLNKDWPSLKSLLLTTYEDIKNKNEALDLDIDRTDMNQLYHYLKVINKDQIKPLAKVDVQKRLKTILSLLDRVGGEIAKQLEMIPTSKKVDVSKQEAPQQQISEDQFKPTSEKEMSRIPGQPDKEPSQQQEELISHPVKRGETLSLIAKEFKQKLSWPITWADIYVMNSNGRGAKLKDPDLIYAGSTLDIPSKPITDAKLIEEKNAIIAKQTEKYKKKQQQQQQPAKVEKPDLSKLDVGMKYIKTPQEIPQFKGPETSKPTSKPTPNSLSQETQQAIEDAASWGKK